VGAIRNPVTKRRAYLQLEELENRLVPAGVAPTALDQLFLEELNAARANPTAYGQSIGVNLSNVAPAQPLAFDPLLNAAALGHSVDMNTNAYFSHYSPSGADPGQRISAQGYAWSTWGESIAAGYSTDASALSALIADVGVPDLGHRLQLLSIGQAYQTQTEVGIGIVLNGSGPYQDYYTIDTATPQNNLACLTGVVFNDQAGNGQYAVGEGLGGVTITVQGVGSTTTWASGGYTMQLNPGTYTVTASGGGLVVPYTKVVSIGARNVQWNIAQSNQAVLQANAAFVGQLYQALLERAPTATELSTYATDLDNGTMTRAALTTTVRTSQAYQQVCTLWLQQAASDLLGRQFSTAELSSWQSWLDSTGTLQQAATLLLNSPEYLTRLWTGWVDNVYQQYLGVAATASEVSAWLPYFQAGHTESNMVDAIVLSPQYQNRVGASNTQFVTALYSNMLAYPATTQNISYWVSALQNGMPRASLVATFLGSALYRQHEDTLWTDALFASLLGQAPTATQLNTMVAAMLAGTPCATLEAQVLASPAYYQRAAQLA
jgi:uncharacterized protein YkwD